MATTFEVMSGPSKFDLMVSLFDGNSRTQKWADFQVKIENSETKFPILVHLRMIGVTREDGSGESWNISFFFKGTHDARAEHGGHGHYSTRTRKGFLKIPDLNLGQ